MQPKDTPSLGDLPSELLLEINEHLSEADRNALARTNREIYGWINHILYCDNIRHNNASALRWAVINNVESTVRMCLKRGATIDPPSLSAEEEEIHRINCRHQRHPRTTQPHDLPLISIAAENGLLLRHNKIDAHSRVAHTDLSPMYHALDAGSLEFVEALIEKGADIRIDERIDRKVIRKAVRSKNVDLVRYLVEHEFGQDDSLAFCLPMSAALGRFTMVVYILSLGVDPDQRDASGWTALHKAIGGGHLDVVQALVARGAKVDLPVQRETPLASAVWMCNPQIVRVLLESGADPNRRCNLGQTPCCKLFWIMAATQLRDDDNRNPLYLAVANGVEQAVQLLLENGVARDTPEGPRNYTSLSVAAHKNHLRVMKILLEYGAGLGPDAQGKTPLDRAFDSDNAEGAVILLEQGARLSSETDTLLTAASRKGRAKVVQFLLDNKWDPSLPDGSGKTPLVHAVMGRHYEAVDVLLKSQKVNVNAYSQRGTTPLLLASFNGDAKVAKLLIDKGANVEARNKKGRTALHIAAKHDRKVNILWELLNAGADLNATDRQGDTPLCHALGNVDVYRCLLDMGAQ
ncbi:ankyrin repeat-containing domain protein [Aspergillus keveii]|uniref:Ankyrin repeat-containing domain protein n=1 Tax=Aspergillus keveii TaxID=714993 RepID=A0ABR4GBG9_9EURO